MTHSGSIAKQAGFNGCEPIHCTLRACLKHIEEAALGRIWIPEPSSQGWNQNLGRSSTCGDPSRVTDTSKSLTVLSRCRNLSFPDSLPEVSIVFIFVNEALSVLLRSIHSAIQRTPPHLLKEIILVDDNSSTGECPCPCAQHTAPCLTAERRALPLLWVLNTLGSPWLLLSGDVASLMRDLWWSLLRKIHPIGAPSPHPRGAWSPSHSLLADHSQMPHPSAV